jgi:hypothetical protein
MTASRERDGLVSPLCSRNARSQKKRGGSGQVPFLLAERAR